MSKRAFDKIAAGLQNAIEIAAGTAAPETYKVHVPADINVKNIRKNLNLTQEEFGTRFGFGVARVRDWEQRRTKPDAAARAFLVVIAREPQAVDRALNTPIAPEEPSPALTKPFL